MISPAEALNGLADRGFDSRGANVSTYYYLGTAVCRSGAWRGLRALVHTSNPSWGAPLAQSPSTLSAAQGASSVTKPFTASAFGNFRVVWYGADCPNARGQTYTASISGTVIATSSTLSVVRKVSVVFAMLSGQSYAPAFTGTATSGDHSAFVDSVDVLPASDAASYGDGALDRLTVVMHSGAAVAGGGVTSSFTLNVADNRSAVTGAVQRWGFLHRATIVFKTTAKSHDEYIRKFSHYD